MHNCRECSDSADEQPAPGTAAFTYYSIRLRILIGTCDLMGICFIVIRCIPCRFDGKSLSVVPQLTSIYGVEDGRESMSVKSE